MLSSTSSAFLHQPSPDSVEGAERILSSSYDGIVRVWDLSGNVVASTAPIDSPMPTHVLAARFLSPTTIAAAGFDSKIRLYSTESSSSTLTPSLTLLTHRHIITSLSAPSPAQTFLSASSDNTAALWSTSLSPSAHSPAPASLPAHILPPTSTKRAKTGTSAGAKAVLKSHSRPVTAAIFSPSDPTVAYTTSHDRQLITWDLTQPFAVSSRTPAANEPLTAAAALPQHPGLIVAGSGNGSILVVDVRDSARRSTVARGRGHKHGVTSIDVEPPSLAPDAPRSASGHGFVSAARQGSELFTWDLRNTGGAIVDGAAGRALRPVFKLARQRRKEGGEEERREGWGVFGVRWDARLGVVSGGSDARVQIDR